MHASRKILIVDDDTALRQSLAEQLERDGEFSVVECETAAAALTSIGRERFDAMLLDVGLPDMDGRDLCRQIRRAAINVPIVMLTAADSEGDTVQGLDAGADDYVTKPFSLLELQARLKALVRRASGSRGVLQVADLTFDLRTLLIRRGSRAITLAPTGMRILEQLMRASPGVVTREQLERTVWGDDPPGTDAALRGHILIIRNAVDSETEAKLLHTVHGIGYRLAG